MNMLATFVSSAWLHFTQLQFWITVALSLVVWYFFALGLAHLLAGAGGRDALQAARQAMPLALLLVLAGLLAGEYFLFNPADLPYLVAVFAAYLLLALIILAVFTRLGKEA